MFDYLLLKSCVKLCVRELGKRDPRFADTLKKKTYAKLGRDHPDLRAVKPCPVPLIVVCNKYDMFKVNATLTRRGVCIPHAESFSLDYLRGAWNLHERLCRAS